jgi:hypothetical protein
MTTLNSTNSDDALIDIDTGEILDDHNLGDAPEGVDPGIWESMKQSVKEDTDPYLAQLRRGISGQETGLSNGLTHINRYIYGTHKARYYLIGAESGVGKTTIADFMFIFNTWRSAKLEGRKIKIFYCSFEISKLEKLFRWTSYYIFILYGIRLPSDYIQGRIKGNLPGDQHRKMILHAYSEIQKMMEDIKVLEDTVHPTAIFDSMVHHFEEYGTVDRSPVSEEDSKKGKKGYVKGYTEKDPTMVTILVIDHLALIGHERQLDTKGAMDKMSKYMIVLRNIFRCTGVFIQQFSTDMMATYRGLAGKKTESVIAPQRLDFGDSKATYRDADVVLGGVKPQKDMNTFHGLDISKSTGLGECFVAFYLMKNRFGPSNRLLPLFIDGVTGTVYDLPTEPKDPAMAGWIKKAQEIEQICQTFFPQGNNQ